jgi:hypothetical protein|tara:strand:- start:2585 stop:2758 length:174 start_codon:yes stop_codon:yes gene_type:complete
VLKSTIYHLKEQKVNMNIRLIQRHTGLLGSLGYETPPEATDRLYIRSEHFDLKKKIL